MFGIGWEPFNLKMLITDWFSTFGTLPYLKPCLVLQLFYNFTQLLVQKKILTPWTGEPVFCILKSSMRYTRMHILYPGSVLPEMKRWRERERKGPLVLPWSWYCNVDTCYRWWKLSGKKILFPLIQGEHPFCPPIVKRFMLLTLKFWHQEFATEFMSSWLMQGAFISKSIP